MTLSTGDVWSDFSQRLRAAIAARVADPADADDILQDVFLKVHLRLDTLEDESRLAPWLFQITRNAITDYYRGRRQIRLSCPTSSPRRLRQTRMRLPASLPAACVR